jgi:hypothetical protein
MKKWYKSPDAKCPYCENIFQIKMDMKRSLIILPITICLVLIETELITKYFFEHNIETNIIAGALAGLIIGISLRLCYVVKYE